MSDPIWNDWHPLARSSDLPPHTLLRARLLNTDLVLWRTDTAIAWEDRCPHRSVRLSNGTICNNTVVCPYHGLAFNSAGQCVKVPAHPDYTPPHQAHVRSFPVQERYGVIFVCLGTPQPIPLFPEFEHSDFRTYLSGGHYCRTSAPRAIENFLDVAHLPFLHAGILGEPDRAVIADYQVRSIDTGIYMKDIQIWQPDPDGTGQGSIASYDYWTLRPLTVALRKDTANGQTMILWYSVTPVSEEECIGWVWGAMNYAHHIPESELVAFQDKIIQQDITNLESHNPKRLPLDPKAEFHLESDRASLAYRKWLKQLGVAYGVVP